MSSFFTDITICRSAEKGFRRRANRAYPKELLETIWGKIRGNTLHIHAFMPIDHKGKPTIVEYEEDDLDEHEVESKEYKLELLGTIHTHPNCLDCIFSEHDVREAQSGQEIVMGIAAITQSVSKGKTRKKCEITYWPAPRPMKVTYK